MEKLHQEQLFQLLRQSMGLTEQKDFAATAEDWHWLHEEANRQSLTGIIYGAVAQLPASQQPPVDLLIQWIYEADVINGKNELLNQESARLTKLFGDAGRRTAILKGQANARLYPDKFLRQPGDIDIWVEGGRENVLSLLKTEPFASMMGDKELKPEYHHVHLPTSDKRVIVEVHFLPSSGNFNPFTNRRLQRWLEQEIASSCQPVDEGFNVPSVRFTLMMQLSHIQRHFLVVGIGLRQICDYYWLLKNSTDEDRREVASNLSSFGLRYTASALMWVLGEVLHLDEDLMLCPPDSYRGEWMLREIMAGGNFGYHAEREKHGTLRRVMEGRLRHLKLMRFDFWEEFWVEVNFCKAVITTLPTRIRYRTLSLRDIPR